jgi:hypothetical protein
MNGTADIGEQVTPENQGPLTPDAAAALLQETRQRARRQFDVSPPLLALVRAAALLAVYGALWLSVRGQHPYKGPSGPGLLAVLVAIAILVVATGQVTGRASRGVSGRAWRQWRASAAVLVIAYVGVFLFEAALRHDGASRGIAFGVFAAAGPLITVGPVIATFAAAREDWPLLGVGIALGLVGAGAAFAGPVSVWEICGLAGCAVFLCQAVAQFGLSRT